MNKDEVITRCANKVLQRLKKQGTDRVSAELINNSIKEDDVVGIVNSIFGNLKKHFANKDTIVFPYIGRYTIKDGREELVNRNNELKLNKTNE